MYNKNTKLSYPTAHNSGSVFHYENFTSSLLAKVHLFWRIKTTVQGNKCRTQVGSISVFIQEKQGSNLSKDNFFFHGIHLFCKANAGRHPQTSHILFLSLPFHFKGCKLYDLCSVIPSATNKQNIKALYLSSAHYGNARNVWSY